jgi:hypothetical protein
MPKKPKTFVDVDHRRKPLPKIPRQAALGLARDALRFWRGVAKRNGGWRVEAVQVWVGSDGKVVDCVYIPGREVFFVLDTTHFPAGEDCDVGGEYFLRSLPMKDVRGR